MSHASDRVRRETSKGPQVDLDGRHRHATVLDGAFDAAAAAGPSLRRRRADARLRRGPRPGRAVVRSEGLLPQGRLQRRLRERVGPRRRQLQGLRRRAARVGRACDEAIRDLNGAALRGAAIAVREDRQERRRRGRGEAPPRAAARDAFSDRRGAFDEFGGLLPWVGAEDGPLPAEVLALLADRDDARDAKDYAAADAIRDDVRDLYELRIDDRNRRCLPHAPPVAPRAPPTATVKAENDEAVVAALAGDVSFLDASAEDATFNVADIDLDSILAKHGDAMRAALAAPDASAEDRDALAALRVPELKDRCRARGLRVGGTKAVLIDRLLGVE